MASVRHYELARLCKARLHVVTQQTQDTARQRSQNLPAERIGSDTVARQCFSNSSSRSEPLFSNGKGRGDPIR